MAFSSCGRQGATLQWWCAGFSLRWLLLSKSMGSGAQAQQLCCMGLVAQWHLCIGRWILTTGPPGNPSSVFLNEKKWFIHTATKINVCKEEQTLGEILPPLSDSVSLPGVHQHCQLLAWQPHYAHMPPTCWPLPPHPTTHMEIGYLPSPLSGLLITLTILLQYYIYNLEDWHQYT